MEDYVGKICPVCKSEIKEGEAVKVCPSCQIPHHQACWDKNNGCATENCAQHNAATQPATNGELVCSNCGTVLNENQKFCPKCGTPNTPPKKNVCSKCGTELVDGQQFCPACGQKVGLEIDANVNQAISQFNSEVEKNTNKKKKLPMIIGAAVAIIALVFAFSFLSKPNFNKIFSDYSLESWCTISKDGTSMTIKTGYYSFDEEAYYAVEDINKELGFSDALWERIGHTRMSDGTLTDENSKYKVSWSYTKTYGLKITYTVK